MPNRQALLPTAVALVLLGAASALAAEPTPVYGAKTVGAMMLETLGRATDSAQTNRQGGFAVAGAVQWIRTPVVQVTASTQAF